MLQSQLVATPATKNVPAKAFCFASPLKFAAAGQSDTEAPISMLARSAEPIEHWYWGRIVHDMAGMKLRKERVPIDWCHDQTSNLGYLDQFDAGQKGLQVSGKLIAFKADDRASEVIHRGRKGVPYEASIDFSGPDLRIEELGPGVSATVNGYTIEGPAVIVREWTLRAVAVVPHGADPDTTSQFAAETPTESLITFQKFLIPAQPTEAPADQPPVDRTQFMGELDRYVAAFGDGNGIAWFKAGLSYHDALEQHAGQLAQRIEKLQQDHARQLAEQLAGKDAAITKLQHRLKVISDSIGEAEPASFGDGEGGGTAGNAHSAELENRLGKNIAAFAAGIAKRMPAEKR